MARVVSCGSNTDGQADGCTGGGAGGCDHHGGFGRAVELALEQVAAGAPAPVLADRLARAAAGLVEVEGGSVCVLFAQQMSVPVGVSDALVGVAERLQFTTGEGPCWAAYATGAAVVVDDLGPGSASPASGDGPAVARQWPAYAAAITRHTAFRGVVSLPLPLALGVPAVLNLYSRRPLSGLSADGTALAAVAHGVRDVLDAASLPGAAGSGRGWLESSSTRRRAQVWVAEQVLVEHAPHLDAVTALAAMRTFCAVEGGTVDDVADALVSHALPPGRVLGLV